MKISREPESHAAEYFHLPLRGRAAPAAEAGTFDMVVSQRRVWYDGFAMENTAPLNRFDTLLSSIQLEQFARVHFALTNHNGASAPVPKAVTPELPCPRQNSPFPTPQLLEDPYGLATAPW